MATELQVTCISKQDRQSAFERITHIGGSDFQHPAETVIANIEAGTHTYFLNPGSGSSQNQGSRSTQNQGSLQNQGSSSTQNQGSMQNQGSSSRQNQGSNASKVRVVVANRDGRKYLKAENDGDDPNNLLSLPECN